uniref:Platelet-derived growth factor (PDGF) family profile domain-containing protein n=1 Tax=Latimeria chalumnae TaxID=7897 RepID=H3B2G9_LATCH
MLADIDLELSRTSCAPREVCLEVLKEFPSTHIKYVPRCVSMHRCGGCCNNEADLCVNTNFSLITKKLLEYSILSQSSNLVSMSFVNHTDCQCVPKSLQNQMAPHPVVRRSTLTASSGCTEANVDCPGDLLWDPVVCQCVSHNDFTFYFPFKETGKFAGICGTHAVFDEDSCDCACTNRLTHSSCGPNRRLDTGSCTCVCSNVTGSDSCGAGRVWDEEGCGCVCRRTCPSGQRLSQAECRCECQETPTSCLLEGKRFDPQSCSCYSRPCRSSEGKCVSGIQSTHSLRTSKQQGRGPVRLN